MNPLDRDDAAASACMPPRAIDESRALRAALARYPTHAAWLATSEGRALAERLDAHLAPVRTWSPAAPTARTGSDAIHVVHWNVLHGIASAGIRKALQEEPQLAGADLLSLNEVDVGMARTDGRDIAFELAAELGLHAAWAAQFLELRGGARVSDAAVEDPGEAWFGLALLSRYPLQDVCRIALATPSALLFDRERKAGAFVALVARVVHPEREFTFAVVHLDVHGSPATRALQMQQVIDALPPGPAIIAGDFNTTTFTRGGAGRSARTLVTLGLQSRTRLRRRLLYPDEPIARPREPLFTRLAEAGFAVRPYNDAQESLDVRFDDVHELDAFPGIIRRWLLGLLRSVERRNVMRLDWIVARGFAPGSAPSTRPDLMRGETPVSDHAPIAAWLRFV